MPVRARSHHPHPARSHTHSSRRLASCGCGLWPGEPDSPDVIKESVTPLGWQIRGLILSQQGTCTVITVVSGPGKGQPHRKDVQADEAISRGPGEPELASLSLVESAKPGSLSFQHQDFPKSFPDVVGCLKTTLSVVHGREVL